MSEMTVTHDSESAVQENLDENAIVPAVDVFERENELVVVADMPGLEKEAIAVATEKGILTIRGSRRETLVRDFNWREFEASSYFRQFRLGEKIDQGAIRAEYKHGVLTVILPMAEEVKPRQVEVRVT